MRIKLGLPHVIVCEKRFGWRAVPSFRVHNSTPSVIVHVFTPCNAARSRLCKCCRGYLSSKVHMMLGALTLGQFTVQYIIKVCVFLPYCRILSLAMHVITLHDLHIRHVPLAACILGKHVSSRADSIAHDTLTHVLRSILYLQSFSTVNGFCDLWRTLPTYTLPRTGQARWRCDSAGARLRCDVR